MLEGGNQTAVSRRGGLVQVASAFGIVGECVCVCVRACVYVLVCVVLPLLKVSQVGISYVSCIYHVCTGFIRFLEGYYIILITKRKA